jgi:hypothetical protein
MFCLVKIIKTDSSEQYFHMITACTFEMSVCLSKLPALNPRIFHFPINVISMRKYRLISSTATWAPTIFIIFTVLGSAVHRHGTGSVLKLTIRTQNRCTFGFVLVMKYPAIMVNVYSKEYYWYEL